MAICCCCGCCNVVAAVAPLAGLLKKYLSLISVLVLNSKVDSAKHFDFVFQPEPSLFQRLKIHFLGVSHHEFSG